MDANELPAQRRSAAREEDEVIEEEDARVFLEPEAVTLLEDKVLDATIEAEEGEFTDRGPGSGVAAEFSSGAER